MLHKLQLGWSLVCDVAAVLLIVLWVRSYWAYEIASFRSFPHNITLGASKGVAFVNYARSSLDSKELVKQGWEYTPQLPTDLHKPLVFSYGDHLLVITPIWLALIVIAIPAIAPGAVYAAKRINPPSAH